MSKNNQTLSQRSIKKTLFSWVIPTLFLGMFFSLLFSADLLDEQAETAFDRTLAGVLQAINSNVSTPHGGLALEEPYRLLEFFQFTATGSAYYHVATESGLAEIGHPALPRPAGRLKDNVIYFSSGLYLDQQPVRVATLIRRAEPDNPKNTERIVVQVAESLEERKAFSSLLIHRSILRDIFTLLLTAGILAIGIMVALRPLHRVQKRLAQRKDNDLRPIDCTDLPKEILPLVQAINHQTERVLIQNERQRQFLHDASHQLRTPLSILKTQIGFALRENDPNEVRQALYAMSKMIRRATRLTNQLLNLARAQHTATAQSELQKDPINLAKSIKQCIDWLELTALNKNIEVVFEYDKNQSFIIHGAALLVQEAIMNILDNALQYSPTDSQVYISLVKDEQKNLVICIQDQGDGMNERDLDAAGLRFRRGQSGKNHQGAGLGLAIVKTIMELHQGQLRLTRSERHGGLAVSLVFSLI